MSQPPAPRPGRPMGVPALIVDEMRVVDRAMVEDFHIGLFLADISVPPDLDRRMGIEIGSRLEDQAVITVDPP